MLKRTWSLLLVLTLFAAPAAAFAPGRDHASSDDRASFVERVWSGIAQLLGLEGQGARELRREKRQPRTTTAADDSGGHYDPNG